MIHTPGHSDDSISVILDSGAAIVGDMPPYPQIEAYGDPVIADSWGKIIRCGSKRAYHAHWPEYDIKYGCLSQDFARYFDGIVADFVHGLISHTVGTYFAESVHQSGAIGPRRDGSIDVKSRRKIGLKALDFRALAGLAGKQLRAQNPLQELVQGCQAKHLDREN